MPVGSAKTKKSQVIVKANKDGVLFASLKSIRIEEGFNVRKNAKPGEEFIASIKANGVIHPLHVRWRDKTKSALYLIDGERRFNAAIKAGLGSVPIVQHGFIEDREAFVISLTANENQKRLTPKEMLVGFLRLKKEGFTSSQIANVMGMDSRTVAESLRVDSKGSKDMKSAAKKGSRSGGVAPRAAARASNLPKTEQTKLLKKMVGKPMDEQLDAVRKVEKKLGVTKPGRKKSRLKAPGSKKGNYRLADDVVDRAQALEKILIKKLGFAPSHKVFNGQMMILNCLKGDLQVSDVHGWENT